MGKPEYAVVLEQEQTEDAEDRLLRVYELLLGLSGDGESVQKEEN
jgi:hypothetical protein